ncbi:hypothetical protein [Lentzea sp. NPDC004782]|uniref:hypothetical protein n=1 Tax=Lentzea sp. NPDC004782 TaxID=3154458 RepID=UPI0033A983F9
MLEGPIGCGKTALLEVAFVTARGHGLLIGWAAASPLEREMPFALVQRLFEYLRPQMCSEAAGRGHDVIAGTSFEKMDHGDDADAQQTIRHQSARPSHTSER